VNKKLAVGVLAIIVVLAIILVIITSFITKYYPITKLDNPWSSNCSSIQEEYNRYLCYVDLAVELKNQDICENIVENSYWRGDCFSFVASAKGEGEICDKVPNGESYKQVCLSDVIYATNNSALCNKVNESELGGLMPSVCLPCWPNCSPRE